jgi:hypothetical protein
MNLKWLRLLCAGALALSPLLAHAQYSWVDDKGMRVFSDRPPPPGTPSERILKAPSGMESLAPPAPAPAAVPASGAAEPEIPEWKKREEDFRKRMAAREKDEKSRAASASENAQASQDRKVRCDMARRESAQVKNGSITTGKGQATLLTARGRIEAENKVNQALRDCS